jgi:hypothetical protein
MRPTVVVAALIAFVFLSEFALAQQPVVGMVDAPTVTVLRGLTVPQFEAEMQRRPIRARPPRAGCSR